MQLLQVRFDADARVGARFNVRRAVLINYVNFAVNFNFDLFPLLKQALGACFTLIRLITHKMAI